MRQTAATLILLIPTLLTAQSPASNKGTVLIVLRQPEGPLGQRLAGMATAVQVPEEVRAAAERERVALVRAQQESFHGRLTAAGVTSVHGYPELNMVRAEVPASAMSAVQADPAVLSVVALPASGDARALIGATGGTAVVTGTPGGVPGSLPGGLPGSLPAMPFQPQPGVLPMGFGGNVMGATSIGGSMLQSVAGVVGTMGAQSAMMMPRASGFIVLAAGGAQVAQILASKRKQACTIALDAAPAKAPASGGQGFLMVNASPSCLWQAQSNAEWLHIDTDGPMSGTGLVRYTVAPTAGASRTASITIAGITRTTVKGAASMTVSQSQ